MEETLIEFVERVVSTYERNAQVVQKLDQLLTAADQKRQAEPVKVKL